MIQQPYIVYNAFMIGLVLGILTMMIDDNININKEQPQIKPCNCLSLTKMMLYTERYALFVDSLENSPKKERDRLTDSLVFYYNALRVNENPINTEK